ncbi:collagenase-like [Ostrinia furnacalis]|uniref:collagenase-like n=1 Tax=Ostrinia furnacalis TaxID=93504 RepID=UPI00103EB8BB|nr:collagenase-like [Ostrinia furnacalis]
MKSSLLFLLVVAVAAAELLQPNTRYHETEGIPKFQLMKQLEEGTDFDGGRIWGGQAVSGGTHPHLGGLWITLTTGQNSICGSSLVSNTRSVTAAHCWRTSTLQATMFTIVWNSNSIFWGGTRINTNQVIEHPNYNVWNLNNDVAVIIHNHVNFNNNIQPIALATGSQTYAGTWAVAAGYGQTGDGNSPSGTKFQANLLVITNSACQGTWMPGIVIASTLCVSTAHGSSTCPGDSGGPLAVGSGNNRQLIGITSFGTQWCAQHHPAGFARVTSFASWFNSHM